MLLPVIVSFIVAAGQSDPPIKLSLNSDVYSTAGDVAQVRVHVAQDGYVLILRAGVDGRIRVILPLDPGSDNFMRGNKDYGVRGRGDRDGFPVDNQEGTGLVLAAWSASPFTYDHFVRGDHWDFRVLGSVPNDEDPETTLLDIVREMAGTAHFDYDIAQYSVSSYAEGYGHTHVSIGVGYGWGYNPWTFGIGFGWGYPYGWGGGCWSWAWCGGYGYYPFYPYYGYGYGFYGYASYPYYPYYGYGHYPYPYYLHGGYPYTFKPGGAAGGGIVQPRPRGGIGVAAGFGVGRTAAVPTYRAPGFTPRTRTPTASPGRINQIDPRAGEWDRARMNAGQQRRGAQPNAPAPKGQQQKGNPGRSGGSSGGHGGQAQPRAREPHQFSQLSESWGGRGGSRSNAERSYGGWSAPRNSSRGLQGFGRGSGGFSAPSMRGFSGGGRSSSGFSGGGSRGLAAPRGGGGGGGRRR